jgi:hypothetical protein
MQSEEGSLAGRSRTIRSRPRPDSRRPGTRFARSIGYARLRERPEHHTIRLTPGSAMSRAEFALVAGTGPPIVLAYLAASRARCFAARHAAQQTGLVLLPFDGEQGRPPTDQGGSKADRGSLNLNRSAVVGRAAERRANPGRMWFFATLFITLAAIHGSRGPIASAC